MNLRKKGSVMWVRLPSLKLRSFKSNKDGVSNILGYTFSFAVATMLMVSTVFMFNGVITDKTNHVAEIEAQNIANYVANAIAEAISIKQAMPEADYCKTLDLPNKIAGKNYKIEVTETEVYVKTLDGSVTETCSTYAVEGGGSGIVPNVINGNGKVTISYDEIDYVFKFDFGKGDILSHSPVEAGYYMVSPEDGPDWYQDMPYRIPISITNPTYDELEDIPVKIVLNETNFDYDRVTFGSENVSGEYVINSGAMQPDLVVFDPELAIENDTNISASIEPSVWYPHWRHSSISINDTGPFADPDDIMETEKDTFNVILTFNNVSSGPNSTYVWYSAEDEPPSHPIRFGPSAGLKVDCINYTPNYGDEYTGMAEFYLEDAFTTLPSSLADGSIQTIEIEGYFLDKTKFSTSCDITIKYGDYYVKKDGSKDYTSIQDAIDASDTTGKTVYVYGDTYYEQVNITKNINLAGASWKSTIEASEKDYAVRVDENVDNAIISSFIIRNGGTGVEEDETDGLELDGCSNVIVTDCEIKKNHGRGIVIYNGANKNIIRKCYSHENEGHKEDGILRDGDGLVITDNPSNLGTEYNYVLDSEFKNSDNYDSDGIVIKNGADYNKIENCVISNIGGGDWSKGIDIVNKDANCDGPSNNVIKDCDISDVSGDYTAGIGLWNIPDNSGVNNPTNNKIIGGNIHSIKGLGIALYSTENNIIKDVTLNDNYGGVWTLQSTNNIIENCEIYSNTDHSVKFDLLSAKSKSTGDGIYFDLVSNDNTVRYCNIHDNEGVGIYIADIVDPETTSDNNTIEYCNIYDNEGDETKNGAILLSCVTGTLIRYCNVYDNLHNGITIFTLEEMSQNEANEIYNCNIYNNHKNGILLSVYAGYTNISHNNFYWNKEYGVKIEGPLAVNNEINNNNFADNNGDGEDAFDGTVTEDDYWLNNYWEDWAQNPGYPYSYEIPGAGKDEDPNPQANLIPAEIVVIDDSGENLYQNIQDAVDNVESNSIVKVSGIFAISNPIVIDKSLTLIADGATIVYTGSDAAIKVQAAGIEIDSFELQGPNGADGILVTEGDSVVISNCEIYGFSNGIHINDNGVKITNCYNLHSNTNGIFIDGNDNNQITNCKFYNNNDGIELAGSTVPENNIIKDCIFEDNDNGVHLDGADTNTIMRCKLEGNAIAGVLIDGDSGSNTIKKCMIKYSGCGVSIKAGSTSNNIYHNHFTVNTQNAKDYGSNNWDDGLGRGNCWDDYTGLDTDYDGIGDNGEGGSDPYDVPPAGGSVDHSPIASSGRYIESLRSYSVEYWNPYGESIILVSMDLKPKQNKIIYLYYGSDDPGSFIETGPGAIADAFVKYGEDSTREKGESYAIYSIPKLDAPSAVEDSHTKNEVMYVVESRLKIDSAKEKNQANMILLSQNSPSNYQETYLVSIHTNSMDPQNPDNDLYIHKRNESGVKKKLGPVSLPKSMDNWLLLKSYVYISKNCYKANGDETYMNLVNISSFVYDYTTYTNLGSISYQEVKVDGSGNPYLKGWVGIGCGLLGNPAIISGKIFVDWIRVRRAPLTPPIVSIGAMESRNCKWITSSGEGTDRDEGTPFKPGPVLRDYNCGSSLGIEELPSGTYILTVSSGDFAEPRDEMTVLIEPDYTTNPPTGLASIILPATEAGEFETRSTKFEWPGGALELGFIGCGCTGGAGQSMPGGIVNAITIARGQNGVKLTYGR